MKQTVQFILWFLCCAQLRAADVTLKVVPDLIELGDAARVDVIVSGEQSARAPELPPIDGLTFSGFSGTQRNIQWINGKQTASVTFSGSLTPRRTGEFTIPLEYKINGHTVRREARLKVINPSGNQANSLDEMLFAVLDAPRTNIVFGEKINLTLEVWSKSDLRLAGDLGLNGMPETGLSEFSWQEAPAQRKQHNGTIFNVRRFHAEVRPLATGDYVFSPTVTAGLVVPDNRRRGFFDDFFSNVQTRKIPLSVRPVTVRVSSVPLDNRPDGFSGAVGQLNMTVEVNPQKLTAGDPVTVRITVSGRGNLEQLSAPAFSAAPELKVYDPQRQEADQFHAVFEQVVIPLSENVKELPELSLVYYNPDAAEYKTLTAGPFPLEITPGNTTGAAVIRKNEEPAPRTKIIGEDILYLKPVPHEPPLLLAPGPVTVWLTLLLPQTVPCLLLFLQRHMKKRRTDTAAQRRKQAPKAARAGLQQAHSALKTGNASEFHEGLWNALSSYFGNRFNLPPGAFSSHTLQEEMTRRGYDADLLRNCVELTEYCEQIRFGAPAGGQDLKTLLTQCEKCIRACERSRS